MNFRKFMPSDVVSRILYGHELGEHKRKCGKDHRAWSEHLAKEGIDETKARDLINVANALYHDSRDLERIHAIASLRLHWEMLVAVCSPRITAEQREKFFERYAQESRLRVVTHHEAKEMLQSIRHMEEDAQIKQGELLLDQDPALQESIDLLAPFMMQCNESLQKAWGVVVGKMQR